MDDLRSNTNGLLIVLQNVFTCRILYVRMFFLASAFSLVSTKETICDAHGRTEWRQKSPQISWFLPDDSTFGGGGGGEGGCTKQLPHISECFFVEPPPPIKLFAESML